MTTATTLRGATTSRTRNTRRPPQSAADCDGKGWRPGLLDRAPPGFRSPCRPVTPPSGGVTASLSDDLRLGDPAERRRHVPYDRLEQPRVVLDTELVGNREQHGVGSRHGGVLRDLLGDHIGLTRVGATEARERSVEPADLILVGVAPEEPSVEVGRDRDHAPADRHPWRP